MVRMRLRAKSRTEGGPAVAGSKKRRIPTRLDKSRSIPRVKAPARKKKLSKTKGEKSEQTQDTSQDPTDENTPINCSDNQPMNRSRGTLREINLDRNERCLRSRSRSTAGSRSACANRGSSSGTTSSGDKESSKKSKSGKGDSVRAGVTDDSLAGRNVKSAAASTDISSLGTDEFVDVFVAQNVSAKVPVADTGQPSEEHSTEEENGKHPEVANEAGTTSSKTKVAAPKTFYGRAAATTNAEDLQERLKKLSFSKEAETMPNTPTAISEVKGKKNRRKARPGAFKAKRTVKEKLASATGRGKSKLAQRPGTTYYVSTVKESLRVPLESRKFFKHHIPVSRFLCTMVGGVAKFVPAPLSESSRGLIDFDSEKDEISHVAEEGGKCDNFSLTSIDDMQRKGIPRVSIIQNNRFNLRKRKSPTAENQRPQKRHRSSSWSYVGEDDAPVEKFSVDPKKVVPVIGSTDQIKESKMTAQVNHVSKNAQPQVNCVETPTGRSDFKTTRITRSSVVNNSSGSGLSRPRRSSSAENFKIVGRDPEQFEPRLRRRRAAGNHESTILVRGRDSNQVATTSVPRDPIAPPKIPGSVDEGAGQKQLQKKQTPESSGNRGSLLHPSSARKSTLSDRASRNGKQLQRSVRFSGLNDNRPVPELPASRPPTRSSSCEKKTTAIINQPDPESSPVPDDSSHCFSPIPCESPCRSPSLPPSDPPPIPDPQPALEQSSSRVESEIGVSGVSYDPRQDAFGFDRMQFKARPIQNPFVEVFSPEKMPKELMPKIMKPKRTQPLVTDILKKAPQEPATSTPMKGGIGRRSSSLNESSLRIVKNNIFTSTPFDPTLRTGFYGASSSTPETDGFKGLRRLVDRMGQKQLQIDAGQKKYGAKECTTCGMIFSQGEAEDEREHQKFHKQMNSALQVKLLEHCNVIDVIPGVGRVVLVSAQDSKRVKEKLAEVVEFANRTVGLDFEAVQANFFRYSKRVFAVFVHDSGKIVSVIGGEPCGLAHRTIPGQDLVVDTSKRHPVKNSIFFIWTLPEFRRKGLAALLLYKLRVILNAKEEPLTFDELAFADLTSDLHKFVTAVSGRDTVLVAAPADPNF